ncbi:MAG: hypothetical protein ACTSQJ_16015 [Promethearchaeota archaeon]
MNSIESTFEIDNYGRVICKVHPKYRFLVKPDRTFFEKLRQNKKMTGKNVLIIKPGIVTFRNRK